MIGRLPWLSLAVVLASIIGGAVSLRWPEIGDSLTRSPLMLDGEWWRWGTTLVALNAGWGQIIGNSIALLVFGVVVEWQAGPVLWIIAYVSAGVAGEIAGVFWQPFGGGNSVAICGLIGVYVVAQIGRRGVPTFARYGLVGIALGASVVLTWSTDIHGPPLLVGLAIGSVAFWGHNQRRRDTI